MIFFHRDYTNFFKVYGKSILLYSLVIAVLATVIAVLLPPKYGAEGSLYVTRKTQISDQFFTYEGFYSQQTAERYTETLIGLLRSSDLHKLTLEEMGLAPTPTNVTNSQRNLRVRRTAPQIVEITMYNSSPTQILDAWNTITNTAISKVEILNIDGDPDISVTRVSDQPLVKEAPRHEWAYALAGFVLGVMFFTALFAARRYLKI